MPITKSGRYSMNPAYAEALERAVEEERNAKNGQSAGDDAADGSDGDDANASDSKTASNAKASQKNRPVKRIEIEPAENGGFVSRTQRQQPDDGDDQEACGHGGWAPPYDEPELRAHPDGAHLLNFLGRELAKQGPRVAAD